VPSSLVKGSGSSELAVSEPGRETVQPAPLSSTPFAAAAAAPAGAVVAAVTAAASTSAASASITTAERIAERPELIISGTFLLWVADQIGGDGGPPVTTAWAGSPGPSTVSEAHLRDRRRPLRKLQNFLRSPLPGVEPGPRGAEPTAEAASAPGSFMTMGHRGSYTVPTTHDHGRRAGAGATAENHSRRGGRGYDNAAGGVRQCVAWRGVAGWRVPAGPGSEGVSDARSVRVHRKASVGLFGGCGACLAEY
jgi:hypothetical protein